MKRIFSIALVFLTIFLFSLNAHAIISDGFEGFDYYTYYGTTGDTIQLGWDAGDGFVASTDTYEVVIYNPERNIERSIAVDISDNIVTVQCPKAGHWIPKVRVKRTKTDGTFEYSEWAVATNSTYAKVDGNARGWWLFAWIASTGPIITEDARNLYLKDNH